MCLVVCVKIWKSIYLNKLDKLYLLFFLDFGKVKDVCFIKEVNDVRDCFRIFKDENLFINEDVIFI